MRTLLFLTFFFCTSAVFAFASSSELEAEECLPYVICNWLVVDLSVPADGCEVTVTTADVVSQYGTSCGFRPSLSIVTGSTLGLGLHTVRVRARYGSRSASCTTRVRVEDNIAPEIECEDIITYTSGLNNWPAYPGEFHTANDNCGIAAIGINHVYLESYGTAQLRAIVEDASGNRNECTSKFSVRPLFTPYCSVDANTFLGYINRVRIGNTNPIDNTSGNDNGYGYYVNHHAEIAGNRMTNIELEPGYTFLNYRMYWRVYIDLNYDDDFSDSGEMIYQWNGIGNHTASFLSPPYYSGPTRRMRVVMSYGDYASACSNTRIWGEVEDYSVDFFYAYYLVFDRPETGKASLYPNPLNAGQLPKVQLEANHGIAQLLMTNSIGQAIGNVSVPHDDAQQLELWQLTESETGSYFITAIDQLGQNMWTKILLVE